MIQVWGFGHVTAAGRLSEEGGSGNRAGTTEGGVFSFFSGAQ